MFCHHVLLITITILLNVKSDGDMFICCGDEVVKVCTSQCTEFCTSYCESGRSTVIPDLKRLEREVDLPVDTGCKGMDCREMTENIECSCKSYCSCQDASRSASSCGGARAAQSCGDTINNYCFAMDGVVETLNRGIISLDKLQAGDHVRDSLEGYTEVVGFLHRDMFIKQVFLELSTNVSKIVATNEHLLLTEDGFAKAEDIKPGTNLVLVNNLYQEVMRVSKVTKTGVIAPLTKSGVFSVNGFQVSCYAHIPGQLHWIVDLLMWPRKQFVWSQHGIDAYAVVLNFILYFPWKLSYIL